MLKKLVIVFLAIALVVVFFVSLPYQWLDPGLKKLRVDWLGPPEWESVPNAAVDAGQDILFPVCDVSLSHTRKSHFIEGLRIAGSWVCEPDSPWLVAASVKGTNNISHHTLMRSGLAHDAVIKREDRDKDGDPDVIDISLEVIELNGFNSDTGKTTVNYDIAPGVNPTAWVFAPKTFGMSTETFESDKAASLMRLPAPVIRVEQGDTVNLHLENTHYFPHTIHLHGIDHPFLNEDGSGNDGVPVTSEVPVMPAKRKTYTFTPRQPGTYFYHCHVHPNVHILAGLQGMIVVEKAAPKNLVQSLNVGAGHVRYSSSVVKEKYNHEFDLHYQDMDRELSEIMRSGNDPREVMEEAHFGYDITNSNMEYYLLNGKSFPYTFRDSIIFIESNEVVLLRLLNGGSDDIAVHTHGHKTRIIAADGVDIVRGNQQYRDVHSLAPAQRVDIELEAVDDGLRSYGEGVWLFHDHHERGVTTAGISPGGNVSAIVYSNYLDEKGWPVTYGVGWNKFFDSNYYQKNLPPWLDYDEIGNFFFAKDTASAWWTSLTGFLLAAITILFVFFRGKNRK